MPTIQVALADHSYPVYVQAGALDSLGQLCQSHGLKGKVAIISDSTVAPLYADRAHASLSQAGFSPVLLSVPSGEASKSLDQVAFLTSKMIQAGLDRGSFVIALGGGVVGDLAGFVSAIYYRGIPFVQVPTTIVSQVDSAVGGKTGVNTPEGKNLIGAFLQPRFVLADPETLRSLPAREYQEGFAEVIKHAAIRDAAMLPRIANASSLPDSLDAISQLIADNIAIKARIVESDPFETKEIRALLNFGHTIGHGIEASLPYGEMLHGEAISLGIRAALWLSERKAGLSRHESQEVINLLKTFHLPLVLPNTLSTESILAKTATDKKFSSGAIKFVLLKTLGNAYVDHQLNRDDLTQAIDHLRLPLD